MEVAIVGNSSHEITFVSVQMQEKLAHVRDVGITGPKLIHCLLVWKHLAKLLLVDGGIDAVVLKLRYSLFRREQIKIDDGVPYKVIERLALHSQLVLV